MNAGQIVFIIGATTAAVLSAQGLGLFMLLKFGRGLWDVLAKLAIKGQPR